MGSGKSGPMDLGGAERSRSPSAASPAAFWLLCRRGQSNPPSADGGTPLRSRNRDLPAGGEIPPSPSQKEKIHYGSRNRPDVQLQRRAVGQAAPDFPHAPGAHPPGGGGPVRPDAGGPAGPQRGEGAGGGGILRPHAGVLQSPP